MSPSARPLAAYEALLEGGTYLPDPDQRNAVLALDRIWEELVNARKSGAIGRLLRRRSSPVQGLYLWGGVGRGKTWLMDLFFDALPFGDKRRLHFHRFMAMVQDALSEHSDERDPLPMIARQWSSQFRVLCFDEFFVSDIADAMLLAGLFEELFADGVTLIATSNVAPDDLYRDGLQRSRFLPAIDLLKRHCHVMEIGGDTDFRLRILERARIYHHPLDETAETHLATSFEKMAAGCELDPHLEIHGRSFDPQRRGDGVIWFDFDDLCRKPRGSTDYIEIARSFNAVFLSGVPVMSKMDDDPARRFVNMVDEFYDRNVKLLITAAAPPDALYTGERLSFEFQRTASRLTEMQTHDYLAKPHLP